MGALFCQPVFSIFEFFDSNYASAFAFEYQPNPGTMPTSLGIANVNGKHHCRKILCDSIGIWARLF